MNKIKNKAIELDDDFDSMISVKPSQPRVYHDKPKPNKQFAPLEDIQEEESHDFNGVEENLNRNKRILNEDKLSVHQIYNNNVDRLKLLNQLLETNFSFKSKGTIGTIKSNNEWKSDNGVDVNSVYSKNSMESTEKRDDNYFNEQFRKSSKKFDSFLTKLNNIKAMNKGDDFDY